MPPRRNSCLLMPSSKAPSRRLAVGALQGCTWNHQMSIVSSLRVCFAGPQTGRLGHKKQCTRCITDGVIYTYGVSRHMPWPQGPIPVMIMRRHAAAFLLQDLLSGILRGRSISPPAPNPTPQPLPQGLQVFWPHTSWNAWVRTHAHSTSVALGPQEPTVFARVGLGLRSWVLAAQVGYRLPRLGIG